MRRLVVCLAVMAILTMTGFAQQDIEQLATRKQKWQEYLEQYNFRFQKDELGMISSLPYFTANCQLHIVVNAAPKHLMSFEFVRDGKTIVALPGHVDSVFLTDDEKLYFAKFASDGPGCRLCAYNLTNGRSLWKTDDVSRLESGGGFSYLNQVQMRLSRTDEVPNEPEGAAIIVKGVENFGHYVAIVDRETGVLLAHKIYGTGFYGDRPFRRPVGDKRRDQ